MARSDLKSSTCYGSHVTDRRLYDGPIVDAHHHLWDLSMGRHLWLQAGEIAALGNLEPLRRNYLVEEYLQDARHQPIVASVHVEALWDRSRDPVEETRWLETLDKSAGIAERYVAFASLADPNVERTLEAQAAFQRVVGVREMLSWHPDPAKCFAKRPELAGDPDWRRGVALLRRYQLNLELMLYPYQAEGVHALARHFPDQQIILNHCGSPIDRDADGMERWRSGLRLLAQAPNVAVKISAMEGYDPSPTSASLREVAMHCIDCFGISRAMFGTDYPVARLSMGFDKIIDGLRLIAVELAPEEQKALFHDNARRYYRMPLSDSDQWRDIR